MSELDEIQAEIAARRAAAQAASPPPSAPPPGGAPAPAPQPQPPAPPPQAAPHPPAFPQSHQYDFDPVSGGMIPRNVPPKQLSPVLQAAIDKAAAEKNPLDTHPTNPALKDPTTKDIENPTYGIPFHQLVREGYGRANAHAGRGLANLVGAPGYSDASLVDKNKLDQPLLNTAGGAFGNVLGETGLSIPGTMGIEGAAPIWAARALASNRPMLSALLRSRTGISAAQGAQAGAINSDPGQRGYDTLTGALGGASLPALGGALRGAATGMQKTPEIAALLNKYPNLDITPGRANPHGFYNTMENMVAGEPYAGAAPSKAITGGTQDWQRILLQEAAPQVPGGALGDIPRGASLQDSINALQQKYTDGYNSLVGYKALKPAIINTSGPDVPLSVAFQKAAAAPVSGRVGLSREGQQIIDGTVKDLMSMIGQTGTNFEKLQGARSHLRTIISDYANNLSATPADRAVAARMVNMEKTITAAMESQMSPGDGALLRTLDHGYGGFKVVQDATRRSFGAEGRGGLGFTPDDVKAAVRSRTPLGDYVRGDGIFRELSDIGMESFKPKPVHSSNVPWWLWRPVAAASMVGVSPMALMGLAPELAVNLGSGTRLGRRALLGMTPPQRAAQSLIGAGSRAMDTLSQKYLPANASARDAVLNAGRSARTMAGASLIGAPLASGAQEAPEKVKEAVSQGPAAGGARKIRSFFDPETRIDTSLTLPNDLDPKY